MGLRQEGDEPLGEARDAGGELIVTEETADGFLKAMEGEPEICLALGYGQDGEITQCAFLKNDTVRLVTDGAETAAVQACGLNNRKLSVWNSKPLFARMDRLGVPVSVSYDSMLAAYLLNPNASDYSLKRLQEEAGVTAPRIENETAWERRCCPR